MKKIVIDIEERERIRKLSHSAIERKRRVRIQSCMEKLKILVPTNASQDYLQKLTVLENTVKYIEELQSQINLYYCDSKVPLSPISTTQSSCYSIPSTPEVELNLTKQNQFPSLQVMRSTRKSKIHELLN